MGQNLLDTDPFTDSDGTLLTNHSADGGTWNKYAGDDDNHQGIITGNQMGGQFHSLFAYGNYRTGKTWTNDHYCQATMIAMRYPSVGNFVWLLNVRSNGTDHSMYRAGIHSYNHTTFYFIERLNAAGDTETDLAVSGVSAANGDVVLFQAVGTVLKLFVNDLNTAILTYDTVGDGTIVSTGNPGFTGFDENGSNDAEYDNWSAGSVTADGPGVVYAPGKRMVGVMYSQG